ncbi:MAG: Hsp33 family molecular chaperone HslO [Gammaproteobacteria bacterium]|nr:Hsp33 family molecular chaperone HslO [Gammaproteobacteria bacterium]MDP2141740.1 Hsp33 family molecular chaperone HslO [Gammaproteobacteria bacterium]MDP2347972.1 Hsp33 family molecular chaperone HslO [Gammaproteobacteria bacterium]
MQPQSANDTSQRFIFDNTDIRGEIVRLRKSYADTVSGKYYPEPVARLLGQFMAASVLLSTTIKFDGRLVLQVRSKGQVALMMAECTSAGELRGIARYDETPTSTQFSDLLSEGTLVITIDTRKGEPYQGIVPLEGDSLAECLQQYFLQSEQLASQFYFASDRDGVAAMMLQQLPAQLQKDKDERESHWSHFSTLARTLTDEELLNLPNADILNRLYHQEELRLFTPKDLIFKCSCSRERTASALAALGRQEIGNLIAERGGIEISCEFCATEYNFGPGELALLFEQVEEGPTH